MKRKVSSKETLMRGGLITLAAAMISACSVLPKAENLTVYQLPPTSVSAAAPASPISAASSTALMQAASGRSRSNEASANWSLRVATPHSGDLLNSTRILVQRDGTELGLYKGARWSDVAPRLFRNRMIDAFRASGRLVAVLGDTSRAQANRELTGDLLAFQTEYDANGVPSARVQFDAALIDTSSARVVATRRFEVKEPLQGGVQIPQVVNALGAATDKIAAQLVTWVLEQGEPARP